ncbi:MAG: SDR family oxidoreductase [Phaeodactylibacter sp.]|nr:SDR family oxidoreductase [Phaeodactylibacter sp.]
MRFEKFKNKVFWITGASSGIGEYLSYTLHSSGARLILSARNEVHLHKVKENCGEGADVALLPLDLQELDTLPAKAEEALATFGHIDYLVNNAGIAMRDFALNTSLAVDRKLMAINYLGPIVLTKAVLPHMIRQGEGHIVITSSLSGKFGIPRSAAYSAPKHALHGFFDSLRAEVYHQNIRITIVIPGVIKTDITVNALKGDGSKYKKMDKVQLDGISAKKCAEQMAKAIAQEKEEVFVGGKEGFALLIRQFFPRLFYRLLRNHPVKKLRRLRERFSFNQRA